MLLFLVKVGIAVIKVHVNKILPRKTLKKMAEKRVIGQIHQAYRMVPYYRKKYDEYGVKIDEIKTIDDMRKLPFITKEEIRDQFPGGIVAEGVDIDSCHYSATTGSTGRSLPFIFTKSTFAFYIATVVRLYSMIGFKPWHKTVYIKYTAVDYPGFGPFFRTGHISSVIPVEEQIALLRKMRPDLLVGYASIIYEIARKVSSEDLQFIKPKFIGLNTELSTQDQRDYISNIFGCPVYDEYSTEETWMIASQCRKGNYHIYTDNVWVEFLDKEGRPVMQGEEGEMILTTTRSPAMPFIRYRIGDIGRYSNDSCSCGMGFPLMESFDGRSDDSFILPSGKYISSVKILNTFTKYIKKYLHLMEEFKIIQMERDHIIIKLVKGREYTDEHFAEVINSVREILAEPVSITLEFVDFIDNNGKIKRKAIESLVDREQQAVGITAG